MAEGIARWTFVGGEFAGLTGCLELLKESAVRLANEEGAPKVIPTVSKPVTLRPFLGDEYQFNKPLWFKEDPVIDDAFIFWWNRRMNLRRRFSSRCGRRIAWRRLPPAVIERIIASTRYARVQGESASDDRG
ncbi:MAG: hypothetical protein M2R45_03705 [Verrucomicrobia subdivision 3 bacterium]|nr:hypothetical protein [Limisphaerales bacterium]MCS1414988.1 hypothetical protein [Limisphaerales bacterium]